MRPILKVPSPWNVSQTTPSKSRAEEDDTGQQRLDRAVLFAFERIITDRAVGEFFGDRRRAGHIVLISS